MDELTAVQWEISREKRERGEVSREREQGRGIGT